MIDDDENNETEHSLLDIEPMSIFAALDRFIPLLNEFFDLCEDLTEEMLIGNTEVSWYSYANVESSGDYIRAKSMYYNEPSFSDVSINMSGEEIEDYNTDMGACFGKI